MVTLYNTRTKSTEQFTPQHDNHVMLYTCGPTVYDSPHIGNWMSFLYWDVLVRTLRAGGYRVRRTMNITDVGHLVSDADEGEDKLEKGARREGKTAWEVAEFYTADFLEGMKQLGMVIPEHIVKATDMIDQQLELVRTLKQNGHTYQTTDGIYFDTATFADYAAFARLDLEAQQAGARVEVNDEKRQSWDFALWKFTPAGQTRDMEWETPADLLDLPPREDEPIMGFPGWHLECSAIAMATLGDTLDIHTGGIDHIPVHHTNEIAQSEAATGKRFANFWLHNNHLKSDGKKISKSLGNGYTLQDIAAKGFSPMDLRMFALQSHYRSEGNFTWENLEAAKHRLNRWRDYAALRHQTHDRLRDDGEKNQPEFEEILQTAANDTSTALSSDLNTPEALKRIDEVFSRLDTFELEEIYRHGLTELIERIDELLGLDLTTSTPDIDDDAKRMIIERRRARENQDWKRSDELRDELAKRGIAVRDASRHTVWSYLRR